VADCWLAPENLMLAACAKGLGACVIGLAVSALSTPEWKAELKIPDGAIRTHCRTAQPAPTESGMGHRLTQIRKNLRKKE
jgi:hypothetical protein